MSDVKKSVNPRDPERPSSNSDQLSDEDELLIRLASHVLLKKREALWQELEAEVAATPETEAEKRSFSTIHKAFDDDRATRVAAKVKAQRREKLRRVAIWTLVGLLSIGTTAYAMRGQIIRLLRLDFEDYRVYRLLDENPLGVFWSIWLPDGMELVEEDILPTAHFRRYESGDGKAWLTFTQASVDTVGAESAVDLEGAIVSEQTVNGFAAEFFTYADKERSILIWNNQTIMFTIVSNLNREDILKIAESCLPEK